MTTSIEPNTAFDPGRCPLCGGPNRCGLAAGKLTCWCFTTRISPAVIARIPEAARNVACVCQACATGRTSPAALAAHTEASKRDR